jgi:nicotinamidase-related amidase
MVAQQKRVYESVLLDFNTQQDFLSEKGSCPIRNQGEAISAMRRVIAWAKWNHMPVISSLDAHRGSERTHDGFPVHCIDGTRGQDKLPFTLFNRRIGIEGDSTLAVATDLFENYQQVMFRKRTHDLFQNPKADRFITSLCAREFIMFGVGLEFSIKALVLGLIARGRPVTVVADACGFWSAPEANLALRQMAAKGANMVTVDELVSRRVRRKIRYPYGSATRTNGSVPAINGNGRLSRAIAARNGTNGHSNLQV